MPTLKSNQVLPLPNSPASYTSIPVTQPGSPTPNDVAKVQKPKVCRKRGGHRMPHSMFSELLDSTSSDEISFDEEDMCGSDPDVETISLGTRSNQDVRPPDGDMVPDMVCTSPPWPISAILYIWIWQDNDIMPQLESMTIAIGKLELMARALCNADGIDVSALGSEPGDQLASTSSPLSRSDKSMESDEPFVEKEGSS